MASSTAGPPPLAVFCGEASGHAVVEAFFAHEFEGLALDRAAVPGGAWWIAEAASFTEGRLKKFALRGRRPVREIVDTLLGGRGPRTVVLVGHEGCSWYQRRSPGASPGELVRLAGADMLRARDEILRWAPGALDLRGYVLLADGSERRLF